VQIVFQKPVRSMNNRDGVIDMYNLSNFEPYTLRKHLGNLVVLVWSKANGYKFMTVLGRVKAMTDGLEFKIVGIEKC
jgi:hypothetical protein